MEERLEKQMNLAWTFLWEKLFCSETNLFYDHICGRKEEERFMFFPMEDEIAAQFPNPCGWGTGMEDCMLNAGSIIDILRLRREVSGENNTGMAEKVIDGMFRCVTVHGVNGFLVRGISPRDGCSCYSNSSRDQFTLAVYGAWRFLHFYPDAGEKARTQARFIVTSIAAYCQKTVTPENDFDLLRLDGKKGLVSKMWECGVHEVMRLPMIYAAAFDLTGEEKWLNLAEKYAAPGMDISETINENICWWDIPIAQMQISLVLLKEVSFFREMDDRLKKLIHKVARISALEFLKQLKNAEDFKGDWYALPGNWRKRSMMIQRDSLPDGKLSALVGGKGYFVPHFPKEYAESNSLMRGLGNYLFTMLFDDEFILTQESAVRFTEVIRKIDFTQCTCDGVINLLHACWLARKRSFIGQ